MKVVNYINRRYLSASSHKEENLDFVQKLFLQYVREYFKKLKENNGKLFDVTPELDKEKTSMLQMLTQAYAGSMSAEEFEKFPKFTFKEPILDEINLEDKTKKSSK